MGILDLPEELFVTIMTHLSIKDIFSCQLTCRAIRTAIKNSVLLKYQVDLELNGLVHNPNCTKNVASCLDALQDHARAWTKMRPAFTKTVHLGNQDSGIYELSGGVYFLARSGGSEVPFVRLPTSPGVDTKWDTLNVDGTIVDIGIAIYEHDLFAAVVMDPHPQLKIKLYSLTEKKPHPLARNPSLMVSNRPSGRLSVGLEIVGNHLVLVTREAMAILDMLSPDMIYIYDWKAGTLLRTIERPSQTYAGLSFLSPTIILLPNLAECQLDVWRIDNRDRNSPILSFALPEIDPLYVVSHMACRASPNHGAFSKDPNHAFHPDAEQAILIFHLHFASATTQSLAFIFFAHRRTLLSYLPAAKDLDSTVIVPWAQWGPPNTRWLAQDSMDLITTTSGQRYVFGKRQWHDIYIFDFNPLKVARTQYLKEEYDQQDTQRVVTESGITYGRTPFVGKLRDTLPFVLQVMRLKEGENRIQGVGGAGVVVESVIMDEERILGFQFNEDESVKDIIVWYFG